MISITSSLTVTPATCVGTQLNEHGSTHQLDLRAMEQIKSLHRRLQEGKKKRGLLGNAPLPVAPDATAPRVEKCPVDDVSCVDKRSWPGVRARGVGSEVSCPACDWWASQGGSVACGTDVGENTEVPETAGSAECVLVLVECEAEE